MSEIIDTLMLHVKRSRERRKGGSTVYDAIVTGAVALVLIVCTAYVLIHS